MKTFHEFATLWPFYAINYCRLLNIKKYCIKSNGNSKNWVCSEKHQMLREHCCMRETKNCTSYVKSEIKNRRQEGDVNAFYWPERRWWTELLLLLNLSYRFLDKHNFLSVFQHFDCNIGKIFISLLPWMSPGKYDAYFWLTEVKGDGFSGSPVVSWNRASLLWIFFDHPV